MLYSVYEAAVVKQLELLDRNQEVPSSNPTVYRLLLYFNFLLHSRNLRTTLKLLLLLIIL